MTNYWKKLIHCNSCSERLNKEVYYNIKRDRGSIYLLCSRRKNYNDCDEPILKEEDLLYYVNKHLEMQGKKFAIEKLKLYVLRIDVKNSEKIIRYRDGTISKISENEIIF